jgi:hypothetical protein
MDKREAPAFLSLYRAGENADDPRFAEAEAIAAADPELARWWAQEQELDDAIASKLAAVPVPADLKARLLNARTTLLQATRRSWQLPAFLAAAAIMMVAALFGLGRGTFRPINSLAEYRDEMLSFVKVDPPLELETNDFTRINEFLRRASAPSDPKMPQALQKLAPVGCRVLRFRGHDVTLICFKREDGRIAHLFIIDRSVLPGLRSLPQFTTQGEWETAAWANGNRAYLLALQGDQRAAEKFMTDI